MAKTKNNQQDFTIVLSGEAGQGVATIESMVVALLKGYGYHVFAAKEYMSRVRGGSNSTTIRIASDRVDALSNRVDLFIPLNEEACLRYQRLTEPQTVTIADRSAVQERDGHHDAPFTKTAAALGDKRYASMVAAGTITGLLGLDHRHLEPMVRERFGGKEQPVVEANLKAVAEGAAMGRKLAERSGLELSVKPPDHPEVKDEMLMSGSTAVALGAVAGGCDAIFSYPMSPGTGVLTELARLSQQTDIVVEQVEDEIAAINMALGANYAGARAMVTTSGGGFALMSEGVSLAGIIETPVVIHVAQRPGPGTGLPTRMEQGDLNLTRYAGHGFFPRAIFAPGTVEQAFRLAAHAFNLADELQIPVFILTDQYFVDAVSNTPRFSLEGVEIQRHLVEAEEGYQRYRITDSGLSPRAVPGSGVGRVCVDSDEHDESGRITEDLEGISLQMKDKRFRKFALVERAALTPDWYGPPDARTLFVAWGSTGPAAREALARLEQEGWDDAALVHFSQVWPLPLGAEALLRRARRLVPIENSQMATFADWLRLQWDGLEFATPILKYSGLPFSVEELQSRMKEAL